MLTTKAGSDFLLKSPSVLPNKRNRTPIPYKIDKTAKKGDKTPKDSLW
jgi:hypothetical protein